MKKLIMAIVLVTLLTTSTVAAEDLNIKESLNKSYIPMIAIKSESVVGGDIGTILIQSPFDKRIYYKAVEYVGTSIVGEKEEIELFLKFYTGDLSAELETRDNKLIVFRANSKTVILSQNFYIEANGNQHIFDYTRADWTLNINSEDKAYSDTYILPVEIFESLKRGE